MLSSTWGCLACLTLPLWVGGCFRTGFEVLAEESEPPVGPSVSILDAAPPVGPSVSILDAAPPVGPSVSVLDAAPPVGDSSVDISRDLDSGSAAVDGSNDRDAGEPPESCSDGVQNQDETSLDCGGASCSPCVCSFGTPELLGDPNFAGNQLWSPSLSPSRLSLYAAVVVPGFPEQVMVATRASVNDPFGLGYPLLAPVNEGGEGTPFLSSNELSLYFFSERSGGLGSRDLYRATRLSTAVEFSSVTPLTTVNSSALDHLPWVSPDEKVLYFASDRGGTSIDVWSATRVNTALPFGAASLVAELSSTQNDNGVTLSADQRVAIIASNRVGSQGSDFYRTVRASTSEPFPVPELLASVNSSSDESDPTLTEDGSELYFSSNRNGGAVEIWRATRSCP